LRQTLSQPEGNILASEDLRTAGFELDGNMFKALRNPDGQDAAEAVECGGKFVQGLK
jgi:hypothetical protein